MTAIKEAAEQLRSASENRTAKHTVLHTMEADTMWAQGDVGILRLSALPEGAEAIPMPDGGQVAPGTSKGSRHCISQADHAHIQMYRVSDGDRLSDLALVAEKPWTMEHPEHGWATCPAGPYRLLHEQNEARERVID